MTPIRATGRRARGEAGDTLIEVLVALAIMGIAFVVIVGGIGTSIIGASLQQNTTTVDSVLRSAAEMVTSDPYVPCATATSYALPAAPSGFMVSVSDVAYWNATTNQFGPTCSSPDSGLQKVTLTAATVSTDVHSQVETLDVVTRAP